MKQFVGQSRTATVLSEDDRPLSDLCKHLEPLQLSACMRCTGESKDNSCTTADPNASRVESLHPSRHGESCCQIPKKTKCWELMACLLKSWNVAMKPCLVTCSLPAYRLLQNFTSYQAISLLSVTGKVLAHVLLLRLSSQTRSCRTVDVVFSFRRLQEEMHQATASCIRGVHRPHHNFIPC